MGSLINVFPSDRISSFYTIEVGSLERETNLRRLTAEAVDSMSPTPFVKKKIEAAVLDFFERAKREGITPKSSLTLNFSPEEGVTAQYTVDQENYMKICRHSIWRAAISPDELRREQTDESLCQHLITQLSLLPNEAEKGVKAFRAFDAFHAPCSDKLYEVSLTSKKHISFKVEVTPMNSSGKDLYETFYAVDTFSIGNTPKARGRSVQFDLPTRSSEVKTSLCNYLFSWITWIFCAIFCCGWQKECPSR